MSLLNSKLTENNLIPLGRKLSYSIGEIANNITYQGITLYIMIYYTDVFMIAAAAAGVIMMIARIWGAFSNILVGLVLDKIKNRIRNKRFLIYPGAVLLPISFFLLLASPDISYGGRVIYALITFSLVNTCLAMYVVPYGALTPNMTFDAKERTNLIGMRMFFGNMGMLLAAVLTIPMVQYLGNGAKGFRMTGAIFAFIALIIGIIVGLTSKKSYGIDEVTENKSEKSNIRDSFKSIIKNEPYCIIVLSHISSALGINILFTLLNYYFKYYLNSGMGISTAMLVIFVLSGLFVPFWMFFSSKGMSMKTAYILGNLCILGSLFALYVAGRSNLIVIYCILAFTGIGMSAINTCPWSMISNTVEYGQWKTGIRQEGILIGFWFFCIKIVAAIGGLITGVVLDISGYVPNAVQNGNTFSVLQLATTLLPAAFLILGVVLTKFYTLDSVKYHKIVNDLKINSNA